MQPLAKHVHRLGHSHSHSNDFTQGGPLMTPTSTTHHDPWSHPFICCDIDHAASTSSSLSNSPMALPSVSNTIITTPILPSGFSSGHNTPSGLSNQPCSMDMFVCQDDTCAEGQVECCADPHCEEPQPDNLTNPGVQSGAECQDCGMDELEAWACTKEGCHAIQQYLDCCNALECNIPTHQHNQNSHHHLNTQPTSTPQNTPIYPQNNQWGSQTQTFTPSSALTSPTTLLPTGISPIIPTHVCHWQNCHRVFTSMPDLLGHVAADHLGAPGFMSEPPKQAETVQLQQMPSIQQVQQVQQVQQAPQQPTQMLLPDPMMQAFNSTFGNNSIGVNATNNGMNNSFTQNDPLANILSGQQNPLSNDPGQELLSCLWDDCLPLPECTAPEPEACPTHAHMPAHPIGGHSHVSATGEPFSPQTMLRHVLEEHLGVPGAILGWGDNGNGINSSGTGLPLQANHQAVAKAHDKLHSYTHHNHLPTPSSTHQSPSPPPAKPLICLWPGCTHAEPFPDPGTLMAHLSDVHVGRGKDSYTCQWDNCDRTFRSRQKVLRHLQSHTGHRPFVCPVCEQAFGEAAPLAAHMRRHAQEKPFKCEHPGCGKTFAISSSLTIHMRTHNGEKPFVCPHCDKGFVEASNLTKHIRTHTGERPFACTFPGCGKRFPRPDQLKRHMGVHDNGSVTGRRGSKAKAAVVDQ